MPYPKFQHMSPPPLPPHLLRYFLCTYTKPKFVLSCKVESLGELKTLKKIKLRGHSGKAHCASENIFTYMGFPMPMVVKLGPRLYILTRQCEKYSFLFEGKKNHIWIIALCYLSSHENNSSKVAYKNRCTNIEAYFLFLTGYVLCLLCALHTRCKSGIVHLQKWLAFLLYKPYIDM